uniref:uncharacterized protein LOC108949767 n=1 Tax=Ciona intestinalis TaxID=7719 RepID=UPI00089DD4A2|nr:uncharacterized protein LOC108949767 [Ciona intestinalis]|eukprot:XP_018668888.1 uncharacterized protein LOC108949767 [Ciona intestinalis]
MNLFITLIITFAYSTMTSCSPTGVTRSTRGAEDLVQILGSIKSTTNQALVTFISSYMDCTDIDDCLVESTSLELAKLPTALINTDNSEWATVFTDNMNGLQDFNFYLQKAFGPEGYGAGKFPAIGNDLTDVTSLLSTFMKDFKLDMQNAYCLSIDVKDLSELEPCAVCTNPTLPSHSLEIVRNYKFLMQLSNYLDDFYNKYNTFIHTTNTCS